MYSSGTYWLFKKAGRCYPLDASVNKSNYTIHWIVIYLLDNATHWINCYPADKCKQTTLQYPHKHGTRTKSDFLTGIKPITFRILSGHSIHSARRALGEQGHLTEFILYVNFVPHLCHVDQFTFHILLASSKFIIFIHLSKY